MGESCPLSLPPPLSCLALLLLFGSTALTAQAELNVTGDSIAILSDGGDNTTGIFTDFLIPDITGTLELTATGGSGGQARVFDTDPTTGEATDCVSEGGAGATRTATFTIGTGGGELPPGATIRFIIGGQGGSTEQAGEQGSGIAVGGGGGATGVLLIKEDGTGYPPRYRRWRWWRGGLLAILRMRHQPTRWQWQSQGGHDPHPRRQPR